MNDHMIRRSTFCGVCHKRGPDVEGIRAWARCPQCNKNLSDLVIVGANYGNICRPIVVPGLAVDG